MTPENSPSDIAEIFGQDVFNDTVMQKLLPKLEK